MFPSISPKQSSPPLEVFDEWNEKKKALHNRKILYFDKEGNKKSKILFKQGEIWWASVGKNIGGGSFGKGKNSDSK